LKNEEFLREREREGRGRGGMGGEWDVYI